MSLYNTYSIPEYQVYPISYSSIGSSSPMVIPPPHYHYPSNANPGYHTYTSRPMIPSEDPLRNHNKQDISYRHIPNIETVFRTQIQDYIAMGLEKQVTEVSATKESTKILKNWLKVHRNNPYPSKTEKVMFAYSTRMTVTQISNWFANARRRIKQQKSCEKLGDNILESSSREGNFKLSEKLSVTKAYLSGNENTPETDGILNYNNRCLSLSLNDSHITPDSGIESFIESDDSKNREDTKGDHKGIIKCKTNLFGTDPVPDATLLPFGSVPDTIVPDEATTIEDKDIILNNIKVTDTTNKKTKIWSITDILNQ